MLRASYRVRAKVWLYPGAGGWHFITLSKKPSREIKDLFGSARGWGAVPVAVTIGKTEWRTSLFPDRKSGAYLLAITADVRARERIGIGDTVVATIGIR